MPETQGGSGTLTILERIVQSKRAEVAALERLEAELDRAARYAPPPLDFAAVIRTEREVAVIAEVKRRSPGAGAIRVDLDAVALATDYASSGAAALSILTDREYFGGSLDDFRRIRDRTELPLLRKDFLVHPVQLLESRGAGADAVLLIVRILESALLHELLAGARELGMTALVEIHDETELERALEAGAWVVGVNNRDLSTFKSRLDVTLGLVGRVPAEVIVVSESGLSTRSDVAAVGAAGADAVLVGEALLRRPSPGDALAELIGVPRGGRALV